MTFYQTKIFPWKPSSKRKLAESVASASSLVSTRNVAVAMDVACMSVRAVCNLNGNIPAAPCLPERSSGGGRRAAAGEAAPGARAAPVLLLAKSLFCW